MGGSAGVIEKERPDALLPTVGGQTALNLAVDLDAHGVLDEFGVTLIGASIEAITVAEDRLKFREAMESIGIDLPASAYAKSLDEALGVVEDLGFPPSSDPRSPWAASRRNRLQHRRVPGGRHPWHRVEPRARNTHRGVGDRMEGVRARGHARRGGQFVVVCSIENIDPMGVHTGDSITVARR